MTRADPAHASRPVRTVHERRGPSVPADPRLRSRSLERLIPNADAWSLPLANPNPVDASPRPCEVRLPTFLRVDGVGHRVRPARAVITARLRAPPVKAKRPGCIHVSRRTDGLGACRFRICPALLPTGHSITAPRAAQPQEASSSPTRKGPPRCRPKASTLASPAREYCLVCIALAGAWC